MKKFLSKKPVMIAFIVAAVIFLAVEIGILVRPVSYGLNYTFKGTEMGVELTQKVNIKSDSVARMTMITGDEKSVMDVWIYRDGRDVQMIDIKEYIEITGMTDAQIEEMNKECMTKDEYKAEIKELKKLKDENETLYNLEMEDAMHFGIFEATSSGETAKCPQAIVFVVVHGVVTLTLMAFAGLAIAFSVKKK